MTRPLRVAIVGAGLGGLVAALALRRSGFDPTLYEQAPALGDVGAGIQVGPNAVKVLRALGLETGLERFGARPRHHIARNWRSGRVIFKSSTATLCPQRFGADFYQVQRSDLHAHLRGALPPQTLQLAKRCTSVEAAGTGVRLSFADGTQSECDVAVGADGIHSLVRDTILGPGTPRFSGVICWRGQVPAEKLPEGLIPPDSLVWMGPGGSIVHYFVRPGKLVNFVAHRVTDVWAEESWSVKGDKDEMIAAFEGWHESLQILLGAVDTCYKWAIFDRDPLPAWSKGAVTLLGDAAHPMLPFFAQGGAMAMEDGFILAECLKDSPENVPRALGRYEDLRKERATRVQLGSRARADLCQLVSPLAQMRRDLKYRLDQMLNPDAAIQRAHWIYEYDVARQMQTDTTGVPA